MGLEPENSSFQKIFCAQPTKVQDSISYSDGAVDIRKFLPVSRENTKVMFYG